MNEKLLYLCSSVLSRCIQFFGTKRKDFSRILIIKLDEIGDLVTSLNAIYLLKERYPHAEIHVQCRPVNRIFFTYTQGITAIDTPNGRYDLIVDLRGNWDSLWYAFLHWPSYRVDRGTVRMRNKMQGGQRNELITNYQVVEPLVGPSEAPLYNPILTGEEEQHSVDAFLGSNQIERFALFHMGARDEIRRWPADRFKSVIAHLRAMEYHCILAGGPDDRPINAVCLGEDEKVIDVAGRFNLLEFSVLCERASLFIGNESGPLHIASANATPLVALFGPGVRDVFYPLGDQVRIHHYFLEKGHKQQDHSNTTIRKISVEEVIASVNELLNE